MKRKILSLYFVFSLCLLLLVVSWFSGWLTLMLIMTAATFLLSVFILNAWMSFVRELTIKSNRALHQQNATSSVWSFENLELLTQNYQRVERKFEISAELISNLAHPEKNDFITELPNEDPIRKALHHITAEMQKIKEEEDKRGWITQGLARFGEILRNKQDVKEYGYQIISNLVKYSNAHQGGLFIEYKNPDGERYLQLMASYAYGKRKYVENQIFEGQGMLGQCMLERDFVFITDVPKDYVKITSGLGEALPRNIIIAPLIFAGQFCGVIELASFETVMPHQIEFLKKVCENIASEISSMKAMDQTKILLDESNVLAQELQSREEEMKQNLEELAATQEEMTRKQTELTGIINAIDSTLATVELDKSGTITRHNSILQDFTGYSSAELVDKSYTLLTGNQHNGILWNEILNGTLKSGDFKTLTQSRLELWLSITFTPVKDEASQIVKILCMVQDITEKRSKEREFERLSLVANKTDNAVIITDANGITEYVNAGFTRMTGYLPEDIVGKRPGLLLQGEESNKETIQRIREKISKQLPIYEEILNYNKSGKSYWASIVINPVFDKVGKLEKFIAVQADITETKKSALDFQYKIEAISRSNSIIEFDMQGFIVDANQNFLRLMEYSLPDIIGLHHSIFLFDGEADQQAYRDFWRKLGSGEFVSDEFVRKTKSGGTVWLKGIYNPIFDINGNPKKIVKFAVDITEEKRLQKLADKKQKELNSYLSGIDNTIAAAEFEPDGSFINANEIFLRIMGYRLEEIKGKSFDFFMGDDPVMIMMWENLRMGKFFSGEFRMKNRANEELWLTGTFNPIIIEEDKPEKIMMFAQFTTQEKEKMNDLNAMVGALKATLPVIEFNPDFVCKTANDKAMRIFGLSRLQLKSKTIFDFIAPHYHPMWLRNKQEIMTVDFLSLIIPFTVDNQIVNYEVSITVNRNMEGVMVKVIVLFVKEVMDQVALLAIV